MARYRPAVRDGLLLPVNLSEQNLPGAFEIALDRRVLARCRWPSQGNPVLVLALFLKIAAPIFVLVGVLHLVLGVGADVLLGARLPAEALADAALDSQNRFYGTAFSLYGVLLYLCATDLPRYAAVLRCILWVFFSAGLARLVSIATHGVPPPLVLALLVTELALPPLLHLWLSRALRTG